MMKKFYFFLLMTMLVISTGFAQKMQASLGTGSAVNRYKVYIKGDATQAGAVISTLQFNFGVPETTSPKPTMTVTSTTLSGVSWTVTEATEGGVYNFQITTSAATITTDITAGVEKEVLEVEFSSISASTNVSLVTLPDGGPSGISLFLCTGDYTSNGSDLYYARPNVVVDNRFSYDATGAVPGLETSTATYSAGGTQITDQFRTIQSGNWNNPAVWESSTDGTTWMAATLTPDNNSSTITIRDGHTVTVSAPVTIDEAFVAPQGTIVVNDALTILNEGLVFQSNANFTGMLGNSSGTITGNVRVERFIPARRAWRLLSVPVNSTQTINDSWQNNMGVTPGVGTHITGGSMANGFDQSPSNTSSIKTYDQAANNFVALSSTNVPISDINAYFLFVRGDRTINLSQGASAPPTDTRLVTTGSLKTGFQSVPVAASGFTLIGNPYVSPIDFSLTSRTNVGERFYVWDPKRSGVGAYVLFEGPTYEPINYGGSYTAANRIIQTGQAFFVETGGAGASIGINEDDKTVTQQNVFRTNGKEQKLAINLNYTNNGTEINADVAVVKFDNRYSNDVLIEDAGKLLNIDENLAVVRNGKSFMSEKRKPVENEDVIYLTMSNMKERNYSFVITPSNFDANVMEAYLEDAFLNTRTPISLSAETTVNFAVTSNPKSAEPTRFKVVMKSRKAIEIATTSTSIKVYPNPVKGKQLNIQLANQAKGLYTVRLMSLSGQQVMTKTVEHIGGTATQRISLPQSISKGMYQVQIIGNDSRVIEQVIVD